MIEPDVVDRLDGDVGIRVGGEQHELGVTCVLERLLQELDPGHHGHPLVGRDQRDCRSRSADFKQQGERFGTGRRGRLVLGAVLMTQVAGDGLRHGRIVVDGQDRRFGHRVFPPAAGGGLGGQR